MKLNIIILILFTLFFQACSLKAPDNKWEYDSSNAFSLYSKHFLSDENLLAKSDLENAIKFAKQSADLEQLARIYLGTCALNISAGIFDECKEYQNLKELVSSKELESYSLMLKQNLDGNQIADLPKQYQSFSQCVISNNYNLAFKSLSSMTEVKSKFIAASLIKDKLDKTQILYLIDEASFYGYKKIVLYWLNNLYNFEKDLEVKMKIKKRIEVLSN